MNKKWVLTLRGAALLLLLAGCSVWNLAAQSKAHRKSPYDSDKPMPKPAIFAEGVISTRDYESSITFTPDGRIAYFVKSTPDLSFRVIVVSRLEKDKWSTPEVTPFSGQYTDTDPCFSPDGTKLFFASRRPIEGTAPKADSDLWVVEKTNTGWGEPRRLSAPVNSESQETSPSTTADGTLYFSSNRAGGKGTADIYRARFVDGNYNAPENLGEAINTAAPEIQAFVSPDEHLLIFASTGRADGLGSIDLYLNWRTDGAWSKAVNLGNKINSKGVESAPRISSDGRYFFWTSTRGYGFADQEVKRLTYGELSKKLRSAGNSLGDIYQIDLNALPLRQ
ncbi:MAG: TolB family protein [Pyrinomonadaceae bacterium]